MKVYQASEAELDRRLALDSRKSKEAFCRGFESEQELPSGFFDLQDQIRDGLEAEFFAKFDDGVDRPKMKPWKISGSHKFFFFPAEPISSERIIIDINNQILGDKLLGHILSYLEKCRSEYCVICAIFSGSMKGTNYIGRFVIDLHEIAVEESLVGTWSQQVQFLPIES